MTPIPVDELPHHVKEWFLRLKDTCDWVHCSLCVEHTDEYGEDIDITVYCTNGKCGCEIEVLFSSDDESIQVEI